MTESSDSDLEKKLRKIEKDIDKDKASRAEKPESDQPDERKARVSRVLLRKVVPALLVILGILIALPPFYRPVRGIRTSGFFLRTRPESVLWTDIEFHRGVDFGADEGTAIFPAGLGRVSQVYWSETLGNTVLVSHLFGLTTLYAHLSSVDVEPGQWAIPGITRIGGVGQTGRATGPHLHLEFIFGERSLPPGVFLFFHNFRRALIRI